jgi:hypothetical protein
MPYWDNYSPTPSSDSDDSGNDDTPGVSGPSQGKDNGGTQAVLGDLLRLGLASVQSIVDQIRAIYLPNCLKDT